MGLYGLEGVAVAPHRRSAKRPKKKADRGKHPNSQATQFKSGRKHHSYPAKLQRDVDLVDCLVKALKRPVKDPTTNEDIGLSHAEFLMERIIDLALVGDFRYFKELMDRIEGKIPDLLHAKVEMGPLQNMTDDQLREIIACDDDEPHRLEAPGIAGACETESQI